MPSFPYTTTTKMTDRNTLMNAVMAGDIKNVRLYVRLFPTHLREINADGDTPLAEYRRRTAVPCKRMEAQLQPPFEPAWASAWTLPPWYGKADAWKNVAW